MFHTRICACGSKDRRSGERYGYLNEYDAGEKRKILLCLSALYDGGVCHAGFFSFLGSWKGDTADPY